MHFPSSFGSKKTGSQDHIRAATRGPSASRTNIITVPDGKECIVSCFELHWRASLRIVFFARWYIPTREGSTSTCTGARLNEISAYCNCAEQRESETCTALSHAQYDQDNGTVRSQLFAVECREESFASAVSLSTLHLDVTSVGNAGFRWSIRGRYCCRTSPPLSFQMDRPTIGVSILLSVAVHLSQVNRWFSAFLASQQLLSATAAIGLCKTDIMDRGSEVAE